MSPQPNSLAKFYFSLVLAAIVTGLAIVAVVLATGRAEAVPNPYGEPPPGCGAPVYVYGHVCNPLSPPVFGRGIQSAITGVEGTRGPDGRYTVCNGPCPQLP